MDKEQGLGAGRRGVGRRSVLRAAAAVPVLGTVPVIGAGAMTSPALAQTAATDPAAEDLQGAGFYRFNVGSMSCLVVSDGGMSFELHPTFAMNADRAEFADLLDEHFLDIDAGPFTSNVLLVDTGERRVLFDAGTAEAFGPAMGRAVANLARAGISADSIDMVVISHAHLDHIVGLTDPTGAPVFPRADILISDAELAFWTDPDLAAVLSGLPIPPDMQAGMIASVQNRMLPLGNRISTFALDEELMPGIRSVSAIGHTPGHSAFRIESDGQQLLHLVDTVHQYVSGLRRPDWQVAFDVDPEMGAATRQRLLDEVAADRVLTMAYHFPFPALGHVRPRQEAFEWVPVAWTW